MRKALILFLTVLLALPAMLLPGMPDSAPVWFRGNLAGIPGVIWFMAVWFAALTLLTWLPIDREEER